MIVRNVKGAGEGLDVMTAQAPAGLERAFGKLDVLRYGSAELRERFGITLAETDFHTAFELVETLRSDRGRATAVTLRKRDLARLIDKRPGLIPCFVGYQEAPQGLLPFMTDGHRSRWSLFFEPDGEMTLVETRGDQLLVTPHAEFGLPPPTPVEPEGIAARLSRFLPVRLRS